MKICVCSDAHGNVAFFRACMAQMESLSFDRLYYLGDAVGYMPYGSEVLLELKEKGAHCLLGNHEAMLCDYLPQPQEADSVYQLSRVCKSLPEEQRKEIMTWLPYHILVQDGLRILFVHGSPWDPLQGYFYQDKWANTYTNAAFDYIFMGHTHRSFIWCNGITTFVNVGSCGLPRDIGNQPVFAVLDTQAQVVKIMHHTYQPLSPLLHELEREGIHPDVLACLQRT